MRVRVGGVRLYFDAEGPKRVIRGHKLIDLPTAILVPGGPGQSHLHHKVTTPLPDEVAHVVHYDHRGTGQSDQSDIAHWNLDTWCADLAGLIDALEIEQPIVLGTSFGAIVALKFAQDYPDRLSKLILVSGVARFVRSEMLDVFERLGGEEARRVAEAFYANPSRETGAAFQRVCSPLYTRTPTNSERFEVMKSDPFNGELFMHWANGEARSLDLRPKLSDIRCPTLILAGEDDPAAPAAASREIAKGISDELVTLRVFENCGHNPLHDSREDALDAIRAFVG
jgi:proline iminopeptidase